MASSTARNVFLNTRAACLAYRGLRADIVTSLANDFVGIVMDPSAAPVESDPTPFVPSDDNLTDLGDASHRFRSLYIGTSINNPSGDIEVRFNQATTRTLTVANANGGGTANLQVQGSVSVGAGNANGPARIYDDADTLNLVAANVAGSPGTRGLRVMRVASAVNELRAYPSATGLPTFIAAEGDDADISIQIQPKNNGVARLYGTADIGGAPTANVTFFGGTPRPQPGAIPSAAGGATIDTEARTAINALLAALCTTTGLGVIAG